MKKIIIPTVLVVLLGLALILQVLLMKDLRSLRDAVDTQIAKLGAETKTKDLESFPDTSWKLKEVVCPYYELKYTVSPVFGFRANQQQTVGEAYNALLYKNVNGDTTYALIKRSVFDFCG
jgi:hypothetical protein